MRISRLLLKLANRPSRTRRVPDLAAASRRINGQCSADRVRHRRQRGAPGDGRPAEPCGHRPVVKNGRHGCGESGRITGGDQDSAVAGQLRGPADASRHDRPAGRIASWMISARASQRLGTTTTSAIASSAGTSCRSPSIRRQRRAGGLPAQVAASGPAPAITVSGRGSRLRHRAAAVDQHVQAFLRREPARPPARQAGLPRRRRPWRLRLPPRLAAAPAAQARRIAPPSRRGRASAPAGHADAQSTRSARLAQIRSSTP